jgi:hypothetical protein
VGLQVPAHLPVPEVEVILWCATHLLAYRGRTTARKKSLRPARFWQPLADAGGKFRRVAGGFCSFSNVTERSKLLEGHSRFYLTPLVKELIEMTVD